MVIQNFCISNDSSGLPGCNPSEYPTTIRSSSNERVYAVFHLQNKKFQDQSCSPRQDRISCFSQAREIIFCLLYRRYCRFSVCAKRQAIFYLVKTIIIIVLSSDLNGEMCEITEYVYSLFQFVLVVPLDLNEIGEYIAEC